MLKYIVPFIAYILAIPLSNIIFKNLYISYIIKVLLTGILLIFYFKKYKEIKKFKLSILGIITGIIIFLIWISIEAFYKRIPTSIYNPYDLGNNFFIPLVLIKLAGMVLIAPLIEELFTRSFLIRILINTEYEKVKIGKFTWLSFIITVLFFGFSHSMWLPGIITGIILNLLLYKTKDLSACIQSHAVANIVLAIYVLITQNFMYW